jgi:hypothetical protein
MAFLHLFWRSIVLAVSWSGSTPFWFVVVMGGLIVEKFPSLRKKSLKDIFSEGRREIKRSAIYLGCVVAIMFVCAVMANIYNDHEKWMGLAQSNRSALQTTHRLLTVAQGESATQNQQLAASRQENHDLKEENELLKLRADIGAGRGTRPAPPIPKMDSDAIVQFGKVVGREVGALSMPNRSRVFFPEINSANELDQSKPFQWDHYTLRIVHAELPTLMGQSITGAMANFIIPHVECEILSGK